MQAHKVTATSDQSPYPCLSYHEHG